MMFRPTQNCRGASQQGFALFEIIVVGAILTIVVMAYAKMSAQKIKINTKIKNKRLYHNIEQEFRSAIWTPIRDALGDECKDNTFNDSINAERLGPYGTLARFQPNQLVAIPSWATTPPTRYNDARMRCKEDGASVLGANTRNFYFCVRISRDQDARYDGKVSKKSFLAGGGAFAEVKVQFKHPVSLGTTQCSTTNLEKYAVISYGIHWRRNYKREASYFSKFGGFIASD